MGYLIAFVGLSLSANQVFFGEEHISSSQGLQTHEAHVYRHRTFGLSLSAGS